MAETELTQNGWTAITVDAGKVFRNGPYNNKPEPVCPADIKFPSEDPVVKKVQEYARNSLPRPTYNHCMRIFYYCTVIIQQQFPEKEHAISPSTLALTALLHDIGTAPEFFTSTRMSFDIYGGIKAIDIVRERGGTEDQAHAVAEATIRHQDLGTDGTITFLGQVIQLATIYDNAGRHPYMENIGQMVHEKTRDDLVKEFPSEGWLGCFANTVREELKRKPWCHSTHIPDFPEKIEKNPLMTPYEK